jgi:hypothetical protein
VMLEIIERPDHGIGHPEDPSDAKPCAMCALAIRPDTGELVLLWLVGNMHWSVLRNQPGYKRHLRDVLAGRIELP